MSHFIDDLVDANHILFHQGIVDAFGHVSVRSPSDPQRFYLSRNVAPGQVTAADIIEYQMSDAEPVLANAPRGYLERCIHSEIYKLRPDVMSVVHSHSPGVLPFCISGKARLRPVCHMCGFLGDEAGDEPSDEPNAEQSSGPPIFEIRDHAGDASDLLIRNRALGAALAHTLGNAKLVLMRGHGSTVVGETLRVAVYRAVYTEVNAKLLLQALALGDVNYLTLGEARATRATVEGQAQRPWDLWRMQAQAARAVS